ncbi:phosphoribosylglycinamide formyltransferase [Collinsella sp. AGMB00827]|uniref:Phosphoribosylglycinamide formyltransferase n=1 Tax=Collinsella ureilytica TaxID=2869515 RepID=A0ABS7MKD2_9ACTN|nr:phosphoribosylglycinamide formyltransferase [Collinsella urealyticum]MBY4797773.1 phosphoribosylglycinamide formyltransferase [Collinsella urealyticum]
MSTLDEEYRRLIEEAGLPADALPSDLFYSGAAEREVDQARADAVTQEQVGLLRSETTTWDGSWETLAELAPGSLSSNDLQQGIAERRAAGDVMQPLPIAVLISGSGTNLQAMIDQIAAGTLNAEIKLVVASRPDAAGLKRAEAAGLQTLTLSREIYKDPIMADEVIATELYRAGVAYVVMAGYMRKVHAPLLISFPDRIINLHPALLPSFPGAHGIEDALARGVKVTGVTVHIANAAYDAGPIIAQTPVTIDEGMDAEALAQRIHAVEHDVYPRVVQMLSEGRVSIRSDRTVEIAPQV